MTTKQRGRLQRAEPEVLADGTIRLPLGHDRWALVDAVDAWALDGLWSRHSMGYAWGRLDPGPKRYLHKLVAERMGIVGEVDHLNLDKADSRRANLRPATRTYNQGNHAKRTDRVFTSPYKGVHRHGDGGRWVSQIRHDGKRHHLGCFRAAEDAARAYDDAARRFKGEYARLNFPRPGEQPAR